MYGEVEFAAKRRHWRIRRLWGVGAGLLALLLALTFGSLFFYFFSYRQLSLWFRSAHWVETPATVLSSRLDSLRGGGAGKNLKPLYAVDIRYRYQWRGRTYISDRYDLREKIYSSGGVDKMNAVIAAHPKGGRITCRVNPDDPEQALIVRELDIFIMAIGGFFCLVSVVFGVFMLWYFSKSPLRCGVKKTNRKPSGKRA